MPGPRRLYPSPLRHGPATGPWIWISSFSPLSWCHANPDRSHPEDQRTGGPETTHPGSRLWSSGPPSLRVRSFRGDWGGYEGGPESEAPGPWWSGRAISNRAVSGGSRSRQQMPEVASRTAASASIRVSVIPATQTPQFAPPPAGHADEVVPPPCSCGGGTGAKRQGEGPRGWGSTFPQTLAPPRVIAVAPSLLRRRRGAHRRPLGTPTQLSLPRAVAGEGQARSARERAHGAGDRHSRRLSHRPPSSLLRLRCDTRSGDRLCIRKRRYGRMSHGATEETEETQAVLRSLRCSV